MHLPSVEHEPSNDLTLPFGPANTGTSNTMTQGTFITGMGVVCSIADNTDELSSSLRHGVCGIDHLQPVPNPSSLIPIGATIHDVSLGKQLSLCDLPAPLTRKADECARRAPGPIQTSVLAALQAWQQAQLHDRTLPAHRIALVVASDS